MAKHGSAVRQRMCLLHCGCVCECVGEFVCRCENIMSVAQRARTDVLLVICNDVLLLSCRHDVVTSRLMTLLRRVHDAYCTFAGLPT